MRKIFSSNTGKKVTFLVSLMSLGLLIAGSIMYYFYGATTDQNVEQAVTQEASKWQITDLKIAPETEPIEGLPSNTISYVGVPKEAEDENTFHPVDFPYEALAKVKPETLLNVKASYDAENSKGKKTGGSYDFVFYSDSLTDFDEKDAYYQATREFMKVYRNAVEIVEYSSKPVASGGREVVVTVNAPYSFEKSNLDKARTLWKSIVTDLSTEEAFEKGTNFNLTLTDGKAVTVKASFSNEAESAEAIGFHNGVWSTMEAYVYSNAFDIVKGSSVEYTVGKRDSDSVMKVKVSENLRGAGNLENAIVRGALGNPDIFAHWMYNLYLVSDENPEPILYISSSNRHWE